LVLPYWWTNPQSSALEASRLTTELWILFVCLMVFNATYNDISVISWRSVLLVEETTDLSQVTDKLYHIMLYTLPWSRFEFITSVVIDTDCIGSCKSNHHTIMTTTAPWVMAVSTLTTTPSRQAHSLTTTALRHAQ